MFSHERSFESLKGVILILSTYNAANPQMGSLQPVTEFTLPVPSITWKDSWLKAKPRSSNQNSGTA